MILGQEREDERGGTCGEVVEGIECEWAEDKGEKERW